MLLVTRICTRSGGSFTDFLVCAVISALKGVTSALVQLSVAGDERWWTTCRRFYRLVNVSGEQCVDQCFGLIKRCG